MEKEGVLVVWLDGYAWGYEIRVWRLTWPCKGEGNEFEGHLKKKWVCGVV